MKAKLRTADFLDSARKAEKHYAQCVIEVNDRFDKEYQQRLDEAYRKHAHSILVRLHLRKLMAAVEFRDKYKSELPSDRRTYSWNISQSVRDEKREIATQKYINMVLACGRMIRLAEGTCGDTVEVTPEDLALLNNARPSVELLSAGTD